MALNSLLRDLRLVSPHMKGSDVRIIQGKIGGIQQIDGEYGPITANAVKQWKWRIGLPDDQVNLTLRKDESEYLFGKERSFLMKQRTKSRLGKDSKVKAQRVEALNLMLSWADKGYKESPAGSNVVPQLKTLGQLAGIAPYYSNMGYAWCAYAVSLSGMIVGMDSAKLGFAGKYNTLYCPAILAEARAGRNGWELVDWEQATRGDAVLFDWDNDNVADHIGLLNDYGSSTQMLWDTVEGNTSPNNGGSQSNGGGMYKRVRNKNDIIAVVRRS